MDLKKFKTYRECHETIEQIDLFIDRVTEEKREVMRQKAAIIEALQENEKEEDQLWASRWTKEDLISLDKKLSEHETKQNFLHRAKEKANQIINEIIKSLPPTPEET